MGRVTGPATAAGATAPPTEADRDRAARRRQALLVAIVALVLALVGALTYFNVRIHIVESISEKLLTIQNTQEAAIRLWQENERDSVRGWAYEPDLRAAMLELTDDDGGATDFDSEARERIGSGLRGLLTAEDAIAYVVTDRGGRIVAASDERSLGRGLASSGIELLDSVAADGAQVTAPVVLGETFYHDLELPRTPVVIKAAPVQNAGGDTVAVLLVAVHSGEFGELLDLGRFGATGETYAVGPDGWMLSRTRKKFQLAEIGLIPSDANASTIYAFRIRDPGGDMTRGFRPTLPPAGLPLTLAAASVTAGGTGMELEGYRDFRGVRVIGAWRWLPDLSIGLVTELDRREAMAPLRPLVTVFIGLFAVAALASAGLLVYARIARRLRRRIDEVTRLGQYRLVEKIGEGGMGKVYRARHDLLARDTAVKLLKPDVVTEDAIRRFEREVQLTARLRHPNTIQIYDFGRTTEGLFYYAMEYLDGYDLSRLIELTGPLPPDRVVHILRQACRSLREAHGAGLIHRDIKPMNLIVCAFGGEYDLVKVLDFGLVKDVSVPDAGMTELNVIPGTPPYIAPERMTPGATVDGRVDIYALGAVAFNLLTAAEVFDGETSLDVAHKALHEDPRRPSELEVQSIPEQLDELVVRMLARDPDGRPPDVATVLAGLDRIAGTLPWDRARSAAWWADHPPEYPGSTVDATSFRVMGAARSRHP
jgi:hypothetical protein